MVQLTPLMDSNFLKNLDSLNFSCPALIVGIDDLEFGFVDVQPLPKNVSNNSETVEYPVIFYVPVVVLATSTSAIIPSINVGDTCLLEFSHSDLEPFKFGIDRPYEPSDNRTLDLNDAIAIIGLKTSLKSVFNPLNHKLPFSNENLTIVHNIGTENESCTEYKLDGSIQITSKNEVTVDAPNLNTTGIVNVAEDVIIGGKSVKLFMESHTHNYTDDGNPLITAIPNPLP